MPLNATEIARYFAAGAISCYSRNNSRQTLKKEKEFCKFILRSLRLRRSVSSRICNSPYNQYRILNLVLRFILKP